MKKVSGVVVHETEYLQTLCVSFETLHPQQDCSMPIMATLAFETFVPLSVPDLVSRDGVRFSMGIRLAFELVIDFWVTQLDQRATAKSFGISVVDTSKTGVEDFLRDHNRRLATARSERSRSLLRRLFSSSASSRPSWVKPVQLVECREGDVVQTDVPLVDTVANGTVLSVRVGVETDQGYVLPPRT